MVVRVITATVTEESAGSSTFCLADTQLLLSLLIVITIMINMIIVEHTRLEVLHEAQPQC